MVRLVPKKHPARYDPVTLRSIEQMVRQKRTVEAIADALGWPADKLCNIARRHGIELAPKSDIKVAEHQGEHLLRRNVKSVDGHPRTDVIWLKLSSDGKDALDHIATVLGYGCGPLAGLIFDHLARKGDLAALARDAFAELERAQ